jgi:hypothetical protein
MQITSKSFTVKCPQCGTKNEFKDAVNISKIECTSCKASIELPKTVSNVIANDVTVVGDIKNFNF